MIVPRDSVLLAALELGLTGGLVAAALAIPLLLATDLSLASYAVAIIGLGAITGRFSDQMRAGSLRAERSPQRGTRLRVRLPLSCEAPSVLERSEDACHLTCRVERDRCGA
jgi:hypothetical protein